MVLLGAVFATSPTDCYAELWKTTIKYRRSLTSLVIGLVIQVAFIGYSYASTPDKKEDLATWEQTKHGSTIVLRPPNANDAGQRNASRAVRRDWKPYEISGHQSIADLVSKLLGFSYLDSGLGRLR